MTIRIAPIVLCSLMLLPACSSSGSRTEDAPEKAMTRVPETVRAAADGYIATLNDMTRTLAKVTDTDSARAAMPNIESQLQVLATNIKTLDGADPKARADARYAFFARLAAANEGFASQSGRIKGTPGVGPVLGPLLDKVPRFR